MLRKSIGRQCAVIVATGLLVLGLSAAGSGVARASSPQSGPFPVGNLLNYTNSDFEGNVGDWITVSNVSSLTADTTNPYHGKHDLEMVAAGTGDVVVKMAAQITLPAVGAKYRVGGYVKAPATAGHTAYFSFGCYNSSGTWLGWANGSAVSLPGNGDWTYVEDNINLTSLGFSTCAETQGSPELTITGANLNGVYRADELVFEPDRAAQLIGADDTCSSTTSCDWAAQNATGTTGTGPLQTDKEFYGPKTTLPSSWSDSSNDCYNIEQIYSSDHSKWPVCIITFKYDANGTVQSEPEIASFLAGMPAAQQVVMVFWQEAEDTYTGTSAQFVNDFETEAANIRAAAAADTRTQNVFVAQDSATHQYYNGDGVGCGWIVPSSDTDYYLADHYTRDETSGGASMPNQPSPYGNAWTGWLNCMKGNSKPIGVAEYGLCSGGPSACGGIPCTGTSNTSDITASIADDNTYLRGNPGGTEPVVLWSNWQYPGSCFRLAPGGAQAQQWQSNENQNGGAVNNN
jgi:hypothetical protein